MKAGESLATIYAADEDKKQSAVDRFLKAYSFSDREVEKAKIIKDILF